jgi:hypothetical protein
MPKTRAAIIPFCRLSISIPSGSLEIISKLIVVTTRETRIAIMFIKENLIS